MKNILKITFLFVILVFTAGHCIAQTDVILAVDKSGTMQENDPGNLRYEGAKQFLTMLGLYHDNNQAGVVVFGDGAQSVLDFGYISSDKAQKYADLLINQDKDDWTELGLGLKKSLDLLKQSNSKNKNIILLSDGIIEGNPQTRGVNQETALQQAADEVWKEIMPELRRQGIRVYSLGLFKDNRGEEALKRIAVETGGEYQKINKPEDFSRVYFNMLNKIEPPSREEDFSAGNKDININPGDRGVIILGPSDFTIYSKESNRTIYPDSSLSNNIETFTFKGKDGENIVILKPKEPTQNDEWKKGLILTAKSDGKLIYFSNLEFEDLGDTQTRNFFFLNEIIKMKFRMTFKDELKEEIKTYLNEVFQKGELEYTVTPKDGGNVITGKLNQQDGNVFAGEQLLENSGNFILDISLKNENTLNKIASKSITVSEMSPAFIKLFDKDGKEILNNQTTLSVGDKITAEVVTNPDLSGKFSLEYKGVAVKKLEFFTETRNSNKPVGVLFDESQAKNNRFVTLPFEIESEDVIFRAKLLEASLIQQVVGKNETRQIAFRANISREIKARNSWIDWIQRNWFWVAAPATLFTLFFGIQKIVNYFTGRTKAETGLRHFVLVPQKGKDVEFNFEDIEVEPKWEHKSMFYTMGGNASDAHIKLSRLSSDKDILEIGKTADGRNIIRLLVEEIIVKLGGQILKPNSENEFSNGVNLSIGEDDPIEYIIKDEEPLEDDDSDFEDD